MTILSKTIPACIAAVTITLLGASPASAQSANATFFLTSTSIGNGGNLGGLAGADNHCQTLAQAAGYRSYAAIGQFAMSSRTRPMFR